MASSIDAVSAADVDFGTFLRHSSAFHRRLAEALDVPTVIIEGVNQVVGGASRQMWAFDALVPDSEDSVSTVALILRLDATAELLENNRETEIAAYFYVADRTAVPVPRVILDVPDDPEVPMPYFVMHRLEGKTRLNELLDLDCDNTRRSIAARVFRIAGELARHRADTRALEQTFRSPGELSPALTELRYWASVIAESGIVRPVTDMVVRHLADNPPEAPRHLSVVHGDYRIGNVMFTGKDVSGVLDWEMVHVGDPLEDLAWALSPAWRPRSAPDRVGGVLTEAEATAEWSVASGMDVDPAAMRWWRLFSHVKANAIWMSGVRQFTSGASADLVYGLFGWKNFGREERWMLELMGWAAE